MPILGLDNEFPDTLYVLKNTGSELYGCYCHKGIHGLACFSTKESAIRFSEWIDMQLEPVQVSFDEARDIAKSRPDPICCIMLCDDWNNPRIHYVK